MTPHLNSETEPAPARNPAGTSTARSTTTSTTNTPPTTATLTGVTKTFPTKPTKPTNATNPTRSITALDEVSLSIAPGEIIALLGPNGAGKTTLIDLILGLTTPTSGSISVCGTTPRDAIARGHVGAVLQTGGLLPELSVEQTIRLISSTFPNPRPLDELVEQADLTRIRNRKVQACSGGEQQRLRFALALIGAPAFLILDEPTAGMDPVARRQFWQSMQAQAHSGTTVLFATHYLEEAQNFANRIIVLSEGRVRADGSVEEVGTIASSSSVQATFPSDATTPPTLIQHMAPEVSRIVKSSKDLGNGTWQFSTTDPDDLARYLLNQTPARDLRIYTSSLEDAFAALTDAPAESAVFPSSHQP